MPWLATILVAGASALGRLVAVQVLPTAVVVVTVWLTVRADAFDSSTAGLQWRDLFSDFRVDTGGVLLFVLAIFVIGAVLQPFEVATVRLLEGYWHDNAFVNGATSWLTARHRRRVSKAVQDLSAEKAQLLTEEDAENEADRHELDAPVSSQVDGHNQRRRVRRRAERARGRLKHYPPRADEVLPTMLGNVLRAAERRAGERYHLPTVETLPRLYQQLSARLGAVYDAAVDALDAAARMAISAAASTIVTAVAFYNDSSLLWVPCALLLVTFLSYRAAVAAAAQYGLFMDIAYDFHRFDLVKALHLNLPTTIEEERALGDKLTRFFSKTNATDARYIWADDRPTIDYWHYDEKLRPSDSADGQPGHRPGYL